MANLTQLRMLENLNGFLLIDKPAGISFSTVIKTVKRKFNLVKVGHGGSLDTAATGLLILLINDANKFVGDVMGADRTFEGTMRLGVKTNTHDIHGEIIDQREYELPSGDLLSSAIRECRGDIFQTEPQFCSVKREGAAQYEIADTGEHKPFMTHVYKFDVDFPKFSVVGTKGLIVRTLINDFGELINCGATLESVRRTRVGKFSVDEAITFEKLLQLELSSFADVVIPLSKALL